MTFEMTLSVKLVLIGIISVCFIEQYSAHSQPNGLTHSTVRYAPPSDRVWAALPENMLSLTAMAKRQSDRGNPWHSNEHRGMTQTIVRYRTRDGPSKTIKRHIAGYSDTDLNRCPVGCTCHRLEARCDYARLSEVPSGLPRTIEKLSLMGNEIRGLDNTSFAGLTNLKTIILSENRLKQIAGSTFTRLSNLRRIRLNRNELSFIPDDLFRGLVQLQRIDLRHNRLTCILPGVFRGLPELRHIHLSNNHLFWLSEDAFDDRTSLKSLDLKRNKFRCECSLLPLVRSFFGRGQSAVLHRSGGLCEANPTHQPILLSHLPYESRLKCNYDQRGWYNQTPPGCVVQHSKRCGTFCECTSDGTANCQQRGLKSVPSDLPNSLVELNLAHNEIQMLNQSSFANYPHLRKMILDHNHIRQIEPGTFDNLKDLNSLYISSNQLPSIPPGLFNKLSNLKILYIHRNKISCLKGNVFAGLHNLQILHLSENRLQTFPPGIFRDLKSLKYLYLVYNPLVCDCQIAWLPKILREKEAGGTHWAKCAGPPKLRDQQIRDLVPAKLPCGSNMSKSECDNEDVQCPQKCRCTDFNTSHLSQVQNDEQTDYDASGYIIDGTKVDCSFRGLVEIPSAISSNTVELDLQGNYIKSIPSHSGIHGLGRLHTLNLDGNGVQQIENAAFASNKALKKLILSNNSLTRLNHMAFMGLENLEILLLQHNQLQCLSNSTFNRAPALKVLLLNNNKLQCIAKGIFASLQLNSLSLNANPLRCDCHMSWLPDWLRDNAGRVIAGPLPPTCAQPEDLMGTPLTSLARYHFNCAKQGTTCSGDEKASTIRVNSTTTTTEKRHCSVEGTECCTEEIPVSPLTDPVVRCPEHCICEASIGVYCSDQNLTEIPKHIPADTTQLYLERNRITQIQPDRLAHLTRLHTLVLSYNKLKEIPANVFETLQNLKTLVLSHNDIQCIHPDAFRGLRGLRVLILQANNISLIPFGAFKELRQLNNIALGQNPLHCDCNGKWLNSYFRQHFLDNGVALCHSPSGMRYKSIYHSKPGDFVCPWKRGRQQTMRNTSDTTATNREDESGSVLDPTDGLEGNGTNEDWWMQGIEWFSRHGPDASEAKEALAIAAKCMPCLVNPCRNSGVCMPEGQLHYQCRCTAPHHGEHCELMDNACVVNPCQNGGTCELAAYSGTFKCECPRDFRGPTCAERIDTCPQNRCQNGGICERTESDFRCHCPPEFNGKTCQHAVTYCVDVNPCANGGTCVRLPGNQYRCDCEPGWSGNHCQTNQDDCVYNRCENGATCIDGINEYICKCRPGYAGIYCERYTWNPDYHVTRMERRVGLLHRFHGLTATQVRHSPIKTRSLSLPRLDALCMYNQCQNKATCSDGHDGAYHCQCQPGFTGRYCENLYSIRLPSSQSYIAVVPPSRGALVPEGSIELSIRTSAASGIILYYAEVVRTGQADDPEQYLLVELIAGFGRVIFSLNQSHGVQQKSEVKLNDGLIHKLHFTIKGDELQFTVDDKLQINSQTQQPGGRSAGTSSKLAVSKGQSHLALTNPIYVGGAPRDSLETAARILATNRTTGVTGCIHNMRINGRLIDIAQLFGAPVDKLTRIDEPKTEHSSPEAKRYGTAIGILPGCELESVGDGIGAEIDDGIRADAEPEPSETEEAGSYTHANSSCATGSCEQENQTVHGTCQKTVNRSYIRDPQTSCVSVVKLPVATCSGTCALQMIPGHDGQKRHSQSMKLDADQKETTYDKKQSVTQCCQPSKTRHRRVSFQCPDGQRYDRTIKLVRRCSCDRCSNKQL